MEKSNLKKRSKAKQDGLIALFKQSTIGKEQFWEAQVTIE